MLDDNPSLRRELPDLVEGSFRHAWRHARSNMRRHDEQSGRQALDTWRARGMTADEVVTDGLYPEPGTTRFRRDAD